MEFSFCIALFSGCFFQWDVSILKIEPSTSATCCQHRLDVTSSTVLYCALLGRGYEEGAIHAMDFNIMRLFCLKKFSLVALIFSLTQIDLIASFSSILGTNFQRIPNLYFTAFDFSNFCNFSTVSFIDFKSLANHIVIWLDCLLPDCYANENTFVSSFSKPRDK